MMMLLFKDVFPAHILAYTSDRSVNYAFPPGSYQLSQQQRQALNAELPVSLTDVVNIHQVHGDRVVIASKNKLSKLDAVEEADALVTNQKNLAIVIRTADCLPVFLYDPAHEAIAIAHCGWKSTYLHILKNVMIVMKNQFATRSADLRVAFGPAIRAQHYEVGEEFKEYFPNDFIEKNDCLYLDLVQANRKELLSQGVTEKNVYDCGVCTYADENCFSHRREKGKAGRMISLMMIKS
ncbi:MAG TPA: peptidoglycan editing factor PgeF [Candidatus Omnitrophota bacterium]|nr:peptidoglycan editing factor PgeF [Candidatus Omnitrophota bacterium]